MLVIENKQFKNDTFFKICQNLLKCVIDYKKAPSRVSWQRQAITVGTVVGTPKGADIIY